MGSLRSRWGRRTRPLEQDPCPCWRWRPSPPDLRSVEKCQEAEALLEAMPECAALLFSRGYESSGVQLEGRTATTDPNGARDELCLGGVALNPWKMANMCRYAKPRNHLSRAGPSRVRFGCRPRVAEKIFNRMHLIRSSGGASAVLRRRSHLGLQLKFGSGSKAYVETLGSAPVKTNQGVLHSGFSKLFRVKDAYQCPSTRRRRFCYQSSDEMRNWRAEATAPEQYRMKAQPRPRGSK